MEMNWDELVESEMRWAIEHRRRCKKDEEFGMRVRIVGPNGELANMPLGWRSEREKELAMSSLTRTCGLVGARAVIMVSGARFLHMEGFCRGCGIEEPWKGTLEEFDLLQSQVLEGGAQDMRKLAGDCYFDSLLVLVYGPRVKKIASMRYAASAGGLVFQPMVEVSARPLWSGCLGRGGTERVGTPVAKRLACSWTDDVQSVVWLHSASISPVFAPKKFLLPE